MRASTMLRHIYSLGSITATESCRAGALIPERHGGLQDEIPSSLSGFPFRFPTEIPEVLCSILEQHFLFLTPRVDGRHSFGFWLA